ncbi:MAG: class I SAM-dependent methyltransferase [Oscillospiraceae bacterium]|nr:class I SAM-dependent methyltransferase [Oscillospiraceae bacterium]
MNAYSALAPAYDALTYDIFHRDILTFWETILSQREKRPSRVLDLACGTGSLSVLLAARGYDVTAADASEEMLTAAADKAAKMKNPPRFVHQKMQSLRLPQPVDWIVSSVDGFNYLKPADCRKALERCYVNLNPGGILTFDVSSPYKLRAMDGQVWLDETDDVYCVWRTEFTQDRCRFGVDLFTRRGDAWTREFEEHVQYAHSAAALRSYLREAGFCRIQTFGDFTVQRPNRATQRVFLAAERK